MVKPPKTARIFSTASVLQSSLRLFRSPKLALILILILVGLSLIGIFLPQIPNELTGEKAHTQWWLENVAIPEFGNWAGFLNSLGFFNVFRSFWFFGAGFLLAANIVVCIFSRITNIKSVWIQPDTMQNELFYTQSRHHVELNGVHVPVQNLFLSLSGYLTRHRYRINQKEDSGIFYLAGDRHRISFLGTYFVHLSLLVLVFGYLLGIYSGFHINSFTVPEGMTRNVGHDTGLALRLQSFTDDYWPDGTPKDYRSQAVLYQNGEEVKQGIIQVNHPMTYKGVRFHQSFYGPAAYISILDSANNSLFEGSIALSEIVTSGDFQRPAGGIRIPGTTYIAALLMPAFNAYDTALNDDELGLELYKGTPDSPIGWAKLERDIPYQIEGMQFVYLGETAFSTFLVSQVPGTIYIWIASALFLVGLALVFYFPRYQIWAMAEHQSQNMTRLLIRFSASNAVSINEEITKLTHDLKQNGNAEDQ
jgi:cytochrome c biogenesis protein